MLSMKHFSFSYTVSMGGTLGWAAPREGGQKPFMDSGEVPVAAVGEGTALLGRPLSVGL